MAELAVQFWVYSTLGLTILLGVVIVAQAAIGAVRRLLPARQQASPPPLRSEPLRPGAFGVPAS